MGIESLELVVPRTITDYIRWARETGRRCAQKGLSAVSVFFQWMIIEGRYQKGNPVISKFHYKPASHLLPRPLSDEELESMWRLLDLRGSAQLRLAAAIAEESGLRIGEVARLRVQDIDLKQQTIFVRLPTKTHRERVAFFGDKVAKYYPEWIAERKAFDGHDSLFHNEWGKAMTVSTLRDLYRRELCKNLKGTEINQEGFENWSTHRLRHTFASRLHRGGADPNTVMAAGGWESCSAMEGYVKADVDAGRRSYQEAMRIATAVKQIPPSKKAITPAELLERKRLQATLQPEANQIERCV